MFIAGRKLTPVIYTVTLNPAIDRELLVPEIVFDTVLRATGWQVDFGGKGFNVSRLLVGFDTPSIAIGFVGGDAGLILEKGLKSLGIQTDFVWVEGETRTNVSIRSESKSHYIKANEPGPTVIDDDVRRLLDKVESLVSPGDWWVLAGSLPPGCPSTIYYDMINIIQARGGQAILDASGEALKRGCEAAPFICKPNLVEAENLTGRTGASPLDLAEAIREIGSEHIIISLGKDGALYHGEAGSFSVKAPQIVERNPIGAGDSMVGGIVWALSQGYDFQQIVRWGVACGAATASLEGTSVAQRKDAEDLLAQVTFE